MLETYSSKEVEMMETSFGNIINLTDDVHHVHQSFAPQIVVP